jgi:oleate hydratase
VRCGLVLAHLGVEGVGEVVPNHVSQVDKVVATLGCMTDNSTFGSTDTPAVEDWSYPQSATLWKNIAVKKAGLGNPDVFFAHLDKSTWMTFSCTFAEHPWFMELRNPTPPYWDNQTPDRSYLWMCAFQAHSVGTYCGKTMYECTGCEILAELLQCLDMDDATREEVMSEVVSAVPVSLPYTNAHFMPRSVGDRPAVAP